MDYVLICLSAVIVAIIAVIAIRTMCFKPKKTDPCEKSEEIFDKDCAVENLAKLIRCRTISHPDHVGEDEEEFSKLVDMLPSLYPSVHRVCSLTKLPDRALLYKWQGKNEGQPTVLMAHYDVVPVNEEGWDKPPFDGVMEDGVLWGRGALDTKVTFNDITMNISL